MTPDRQMRQEAIDLAADKLVEAERENFIQRIESLRSVPLSFAADLCCCQARTIEKHAPVFHTGKRDKSILLADLEVFRAEHTTYPKLPI